MRFAPQEALTPQRTLSPEAAELGRRTYTAGVRSLLYGSLLGAAVVALGISFAVRALEVLSLCEPISRGYQVPKQCWGLGLQLMDAIGFMG